MGNIRTNLPSGKPLLPSPGKRLPVALVRHAIAQGWLSAWEADFMQATARKRRMASVLVYLKRIEINETILARLAAEGGDDDA
jgi:hypothetical protein